MPKVHKDFHGGLSYGLAFLEEQYGPEGVHTFLSGLAKSVYAPLVKSIRQRGLPALQEHWEDIFRLEKGEAEMEIVDNTLIIRVHRCPAVHHIKEHGYSLAPNFCEHTRITNEAICKAAGYDCSVEYVQDEGRCVQRFWRAER